MKNQNYSNIFSKQSQQGTLLLFGLYRILSTCDIDHSLITYLFQEIRKIFAPAKTGFFAFNKKPSWKVNRCDSLNEHKQRVLYRAIKKLSRWKRWETCLVYKLPVKLSFCTPRIFCYFVPQVHILLPTLHAGKYSSTLNAILALSLTIITLWR